MAVKMSGIDEWVEALRQLPVELSGKNGGPIRAALSYVARDARDIARSRAPYDPQGFGAHLRDQIIMKRDTNPRAVDNAAERYIVTVRYKAKKYSGGSARSRGRNRKLGRYGAASVLSAGTYAVYGDFYYWRFQEFGAPGRNIPAKSFLRSTFEENKQRYVALAQERLAAAIQTIVRKLSKG